MRDIGTTGADRLVIDDRRVLVVVPTLDEAENIEALLAAVRTWLPDAGILVVDDGSTDATVALVERAAALIGNIDLLRRDGQRGLGPSYRDGFHRGLRDGYEVIVQMDADLSHEPSALPVLIRAVQDGADLAIGSRYVHGGSTPGWPATRRLLSGCGNAYARTVLRLPIRDVTSGYRAYRAELLQRVELDAVTSTGFGFQVDMTDRCHRLGAPVAEVPIAFHDRRAGYSKMSTAIVAEALLMVTRRALHPATEVARARPAFAPTAEGALDAGPRR